MDIAVEVARKAFEGPWRQVPPGQRAKYLAKLADLLEENLEQLASIESLDNGKAFNMAKGDVTGAAECLRYYAGWADKIEGKVIDTNTDTFSYTRQEPVGIPPAIGASQLRTDGLADWCLRSNYPMEFPSADVVMENRPRHRVR